jgi:hypothetical protein
VDFKLKFEVLVVCFGVLWYFWDLKDSCFLCGKFVGCMFLIGQENSVLGHYNEESFRYLILRCPFILMNVLGSCKSCIFETIFYLRF